MAIGDPEHFAQGHPMRIMTICICVLHNGWAVVGKTCPASPENFDEEVGKKLAHEDCVRQIWPLLGFLLRQTLWDASPGQFDRLTKA